MRLIFPHQKQSTTDRFTRIILLACAATFVACSGGGGSNNDPIDPIVPVILKANVTGLTESNAMVVKNQSNNDDLTILGNGLVSFRQSLRAGDTYNVILEAEPIDKKCTINNGQGVIVASAPDPVVHIVCNSPSNTYTVGGTITGLRANRLVMLLNNGTDLSSFNGNTDGSPLSYAFHNPIVIGSDYNVTVAANPNDEVCTVANIGAYQGTNKGNNNVNDVNFICSPLSSTHTIGGTVTGLVPGDQVVLQNNGGDTKTITSNGPFTFNVKVAHNSSYDVSILAQSADEQCTLQHASGEGQAVQGDITNIKVICAGESHHFYTISGTVTGWSGSKLVLKNNKTTTYATVASDGTFSFAPIVGESPYEIVVSTFPVLQNCTVANNSGIIEQDLSLVVSCKNDPVSTIYSFTGSGDIVGYPVGLIQNSQGDLYGITTVRMVTPYRDDRDYNTGSIFKLTTKGTISHRYTFRGSNPDGIGLYDPSFPTGLMEGQDKNIYVTTYLGGPGPDTKTIPDPSTKVGEIYKLTTSSAPTSFTPFFCGVNPLRSSCTNDVAPISELIQDSSGTFYGVAYGYAYRTLSGRGGMVYKIAADGTKTPLHSFQAADSVKNGLHPNGKLTLLNGYLYGITEQGGQFGKGTIYRVSVNGTNFEPIYHFNSGIMPPHPGIGAPNGNGVYVDPYANPYSGMTLGLDGNLYGVAKYGALNNAGWIFKVVLTSKPIKVDRLYSFAAGNNPTAGLIQLSDGYFYGTTLNGGTRSKGSVFRFIPPTTPGSEGKLTTIHNFAGRNGEGDGETPSTRLVVGKDGNLYGATRFGGDDGVGAIYKVGRN